MFDDERKQGMSTMAEGNSRLAFTVVLAVVLCASGCGSTQDGIDAKATDTPGTDQHDTRTDEHEVPSVPIVQPVCEVDGLLPEGEPIPIDDFFKPPAEIRPFPNLALTTLDADAPSGFRPAFEDHAFASALNVLDGFGSTAPFVVPLADPPDPESLTDGSIFLVRTDDADEPNLDPDRLQDSLVPVNAAWNADAGALVVEPLVPLQEKARYALVVTRCLKDDSGMSVGRAPAMDDLASASGNSPMAIEMGLARRFLDRLDVNLPEEAVALVLPTVVRSTTSRLRSIADAAAKAGVFDPEIEWAMDPALPDGSLDPAFLAMYDGLAEFMDDQIEEGEDPMHFYDSIGLAAQGHFTIRRFLDPEEWTQIDPGSTPKPIEEQDVKFFLTIPKEDAGSGLVQPFPMVIFQHAFGVCKETAIGVAGMYARLGMATIGIDAVAHGHRSGDGKWQCPIDPMTFLTLGEPVRLWYNFAESAVSLAQLAFMTHDLELDIYPPPSGDGINDVDGEIVGITGQSMGAFLSATVMGFCDRIGPAVINVGGGQEGLFFAWSMLSSTGVDPMDLSFASVNGLVLDIMAPVQMVFDDVEPLVFASGMLGPGGNANRQVLVQQAIEDEAVPGVCPMRLARTLGIPRLTPGFHEFAGLEDIPAPVTGNMEGNRTGALAQFSPAAHEFLLTNHWTDKDPYLLVRAQVQAAVFLRSFFDGGVSTVIDPYADGVIDPYKP